jgi:hypothetical protein
MKALFDEAKANLDVLTSFNKSLSNDEVKDLLNSIYSKISDTVTDVNVNGETAESFFKGVLKNISKIEKSKICDTDNLYFINDDIAMLQDTETDIFYIVYDTIWLVLGTKFGLNYKEISELLSGILRLEYNCKVNTTDKLTVYSYYHQLRLE